MLLPQIWFDFLDKERQAAEQTGQLSLGFDYEFRVHDNPHGIDDRKPLPLNAIIEAHFLDDQGSAATGTKPPASKTAEVQGEEPPPKKIARAVILGKPGCGMSTLLQWVAYQTACGIAPFSKLGRIPVKVTAVHTGWTWQPA